MDKKVRDIFEYIDDINTEYYKNFSNIQRYIDYIKLEMIEENVNNGWVVECIELIENSVETIELEGSRILAYFTIDEMLKEYATNAYVDREVVEKMNKINKRFRNYNEHYAFDDDGQELNIPMEILKMLHILSCDLEIKPTKVINIREAAHIHEASGKIVELIDSTRNGESYFVDKGYDVKLNELVSRLEKCHPEYVKRRIKRQSAIKLQEQMLKHIEGTKEEYNTRVRSYNDYFAKRICYSDSLEKEFKGDY